MCCSRRLSTAIPIVGFGTRQKHREMAVVITLDIVITDVTGYTSLFRVDRGQRKLLWRGLKITQCQTEKEQWVIIQHGPLLDQCWVNITNRGPEIKKR